ncbi:HET-domain-containing protein [Fusarium austroafricanum]|uniref:HET-domain-containing protein n=1 Tax=Fusarium austroafricanum TaxID=2364996 RepID=A0A8H4KKC9_9HYPO|nr:HET-domain-containing protein [Fusarium austroafricanum]
MWLINARTLHIKNFVGVNVPKYAILSHTWEDGEVTFQDFLALSHQNKTGYAKISGACMRTIRDGLEYIWVDTCCIDKSSSTELSEAINSMFDWYQRASICYAYLSDVPEHSPTLTDIRNDRQLTEPEMTEILRSDFARSRWFTRGWTLQELIAPQEVKFYNTDWQFIGAKQSLSGILSQITAIEEDVLTHRVSLENICVARKMSWAAKRVTTRIEDQAYCLLGIFGVNLPLIYGEGHRAFTRLQEAIISINSDQSIFAWDSEGSDYYDTGLLAPYVSCFMGAGKIVNWGDFIDSAEPHVMTNKGLSIRIPLLKKTDNPDGRLGILACRYEDDFRGPISLELHTTTHPSIFKPTPTPSRLSVVPLLDALRTKPDSIFIRRSMLGTASSGGTLSHTSPDNMKCWVRLTSPPDWAHIDVHDAFPSRYWNKATKTMWMQRGEKIQGALHLLSKDGKEVIVAFGYVRVGTRAMNSSWASEWVYLDRHEEQKSLEHICNEAAVVSSGMVNASHTANPSFKVRAAIKRESIMGENIFVVDVDFYSTSV